MQRLFLAFALALATALTACGGSGGDSATAAPGATGATIGATGGTLEGPDGVTLSIPEGSLPAPTTFRIARDSGDAPPLGGAMPITPIYAVTPHGTEFAAGARLSIPFDPALVAPGTLPVMLKAQPNGTWRALVSDVIGNRVLATDTPGLSYFAVGTCYTTFNTTSPYEVMPLFACPSAHELKLVLLDGNAAELPVPRTPSGTPLPVLDIAAPTTLSYRMTWRRPAGTQRSDRLWMQVYNAGLEPSQQPLTDFPFNGDFTRTFTTQIDPARVPGSGAAGGVVVRLKASVDYTDDNAFYPGCVCFRPATWTFEAELLVRVRYTGTAPVITQQPAPVAVTEGQSATFTVAATGPNLSAVWTRGRGAQANDLPATVVPMPNGTASLTIAPTTVAQHNGWAYAAQVCSNRGVQGQERCVLSNAGQLTVAAFTVPPTFTVQPASVTVIAGQTASLTAAATGQPAPTITWSRVVTNGPFLELTPICTPATGTGTSTTATCTTAPLTLADNGMRIVADAGNGPDAANNVRSTIATITVLPQPVAPTITTPAEPADRTIATGGSVSWTVGASGTAPLNYTWRTISPLTGAFNDGGACDQSVPAGSRNAATLALANVPFACNGYKFQLVVSNGTAPDATSRQALLTVTPAAAAPTITTALADRSVPDGTQVTFSVVAGGTPPSFTYTWTLDGAAVPGVVSGCTAASASCTFTARLAQTGKTVRVGVANGTAPDAASSATLTVTTNDMAASITQQPASASTVVGGSAGFVIGVAGTPTPAVTWQTSLDGTTWTNAGTGTTFTITGATLAQNGLRIRAEVVNTVATPSGLQTVRVPSNVVTLTVTPAGVPGMAVLAGDFSAGNGQSGTPGVGTSARFDFPEGLTADAAGNLFVSNSNGSWVTKIDPGTAVTPVRLHAATAQTALAPNGDLFSVGASDCGLLRASPPLVPTGPAETLGVVGCLGGETRGAAVDASGLLYMSQLAGNSILLITPAPQPGVANATTIAGAGSRFVAPGSVDGTGSAARFNAPRGIAFGPDGNLYVADSGNHTIRRITPQAVVTTFAGSAGQAGTVDGAGAAARFNNPTDLAFDAAGNLVVLERGDPVNPQAYVRRVTLAGVVTTLFDATAESVALAQPAQAGFARQLRGVAVLPDGRIALSAGNAILVRTLP